MRILLVDIETAPNRAYVWGLFDQNIAINQVEQSGYVLCWAAKWVGERGTAFQSCQSQTPKQMLASIHEMLNTADVVVHYNGLKFDIPTLNKEFVKHGFTPPAPYKQVDLMRVVRHAFRFESNKLDFVSQALGLGTKKKHEGFTLWIGCMNGDKRAWKKMERYNRGDVDLLDKLYPVLLPWISKHPNHSAESGVECCPKCGSRKFHARGTVVTSTLSYARFQCRACGGWFRGIKSVTPRGGKRTVNV